MKVRKLAVALALAGGLGSGMAQALGLGEIELQSWLNEPLDADISLNQSRGVDPGEVFVNVAPEAAYQRVGLERHQFLSQLRFEVVTGADGNLSISVSSREPVREPYLNFLLELTWPNGRLMREYAVLVDPPVYAEESGIQEQISAPAVARQSAAGSARSSESIRRQETVQGSTGRGASAGTFGPTGSSDTLWTIAQQVRPNDSVSMQQVMLALQDLNPGAFIGGNINRLKRGEILRIPSIEQISDRSRAEANQIVARQNQEFQSPRAVDATDTASAGGAGAGTAAGGDELRLLVADEADTRTSEEGGSAGGDGDLPGGADAGSAMAMEELEAARRANEDLNTRVEDLQDQVETLQRLLELKNSQLADLQGLSAEAAEDGTEVSGDAPGGPVGESSGSTVETAEELDAEVTTASDAGPEIGNDGQQPSEEELTPADGESVEPEVVSDEAGAAAATPEPEAAIEQAGDESAASELAEEPATPPKAEPAPAQPPVVSPEKAFPGNIIDGILNNPMYQIALGGGLVLLLLLLLLVARRNASREKEFYEQLNSDDGDDKDSFDLNLDDGEEQSAGEGDVLAEADTYIAYGQWEQASQVLEAAISREPSRADLRLKLLAVYAESQDRGAFEKQHQEIAALEDEDALAQADILREKLAEAEAMPSIDDLESQLRTGSFGSSPDLDDESRGGNLADADPMVSDELQVDEFEATAPENDENEFGELASDVEADKDSRDDLIEYDLSVLDQKADEDVSESADELPSETDFASLELDEELDKQKAKDPDDELDLDLEFESAFEDVSLAEGDDKSLDSSDLEDDLPDTGLASSAADTGDGAEEIELAEEFDAELDDSLDESFLDELDAELDKVADEEKLTGELDMDESDLDDLELDVSDEDLALMEEFSEFAEPVSGAGDQPSLDDELNLEEALADIDPDESRQEQQNPETLAEEAELSEDETPEADLEDDAVPVASDALDAGLEQSETVADIDENDLGEDDDFDFLAGTDEAATKLDLARAYIEMGDGDGARDILEEVALEGTEEQKAEAKELLKNLS
ncbi:hypothetical protein C7H09_17330 [Marinobacter fuscus]|uniref:FimV N-terminal domain-containing protein n=1 Tax=Marinobacter fuscus TaxID=2109942 RepID=A0A2T1K3Q2_9GAMM|nr:FimV/HubP family polar landmark protein [Marinobacter fuscus]PSF04794.1 hypothetical protein C7H09_17330 [Marinobacter fuscus]